MSRTSHINCFSESGLSNRSGEAKQDYLLGFSRNTVGTRSSRCIALENRQRSLVSVHNRSDRPLSASCDQRLIAYVG